MLIVYIIITILMIGVLILVHEFGHFLAARIFNVKVDEFSLGMGPAIYQHQTEETLYSIRLFPIGGYCSLQGETQEDQTEPVYLLDGSVTEVDIKNKEPIDESKSFINKPPWQKIIILVAGVTMNFLMAIALIFLAQLLAGKSFSSSLINSFTVFGQLVGLIFLSLKMLFTGAAGISDLTGPVGIVQIVQEYYSYGFIYLLLFTAMLSVNLGILNLLPIPALDGGQILIIFIEKLKNGTISERIKGILFTLSYMLLLGLGIFVAFNDVMRFIQ